MANHQAQYRAYLLRIWPAKEGERTVWRASLEDPHTGQRLGFSNLERLFVYLSDQTTMSDPDQDATRSSVF